MSKFKVGDRVRWPGGEVEMAEVLVAEPDKPGYIVLTDDGGEYWFAKEGSCELVPPDPTEALIAAAYAWVDYLDKFTDSPPASRTPRALYDAIKAHREAQQ